MSTSLLYHGFGIRGYQYVKTEYEGGKVIFTVRQETDALRVARPVPWTQVYVMVFAFFEAWQVYHPMRFLGRA